MKLALVQMTSVSDVAANIAAATALIERAVATEAPDFIALPEHWNWAGGTPAEKRAAADAPRGGVAAEALRTLAARHRVWIHGGSILERTADGTKVHNTTFVFDRTGREVARYRKIHLFDITAPDGTVYAESASVAPGRDLVTYDCEGVRVGCAICYDLRFPELFQALVEQGAAMIVLPASFTLQTGKDHWEVLCRARAIETQTWFLAPGQTGSYRDGQGERRFTYGHSLIADPWGHVVAKASDGPGLVTARLDPALLAEVRRQIPLGEHRVLGRANASAAAA